MKVTTNLSRLDIVKFNLNVIPRMKSTYVAGLVFALLTLAFFFWKEGIPCNSSGWTKYLVVSLVGGISATLGGSILSLVGIVLTANSKNGILGEHRYELLEQGLLEKTIANESISNWSSILEISEHDQYLLIRISSYLFHVIPKRCFSNIDEYQRFHQQALSYLEKAHSDKNETNT